MVEVEDVEVARPELVHAGAELRAALDQALRLSAPAGPVLGLLAPVVVEDVHAADCGCSPSKKSTASSKRCHVQSGPPRWDSLIAIAASLPLSGYSTTSGVT